jgi:outer membrane lipoprotein SlyB
MSDIARQLHEIASALGSIAGAIIGAAIIRAFFNK